jgi:hypothetical protein
MHTPQETIQEILAVFEELGDACGGKKAGILFWKVGTHT